MKSRRDLLVAVAALAGVALLATIVIRTVLDAQDRGRDALERNQRAAVEHLAASMEQRFQSTLEALAGLGARPFKYVEADEEDQELLQDVQELVPDLESGMLLVAPDGTVTNGTLLQDPSSVGTTLERPGLDAVLEGATPAILPAAPGLTTGAPTLAIAYPTLDESGRVIGAFLLETIVDEESDFNQEIAALRQGDTGRFTFVDSQGIVIVSTDADRLGKPLANTALLEAGPGFRRASGRVIAIEDIPSAGWRLIFTQDEEEFEAGLGERVQSALLLLIVTGLLLGGLAFVGVLRRLRAERLERKRIEEISETREEFISIVSHELRTPAAGVMGFLQSALDHWDGMDDEARRHTVERAAANAQRLHALTRDVLDTSKAETGELSHTFGEVNLQREVEAAVLAAQEVEPERNFVANLPDAPAIVRADADRIQQVLANLIDNAVKASPVERPIEVKLTSDGQAARVEVSDRGAGLSPAQIDEIFEKFVRGRSRVSGTGLGLYVCRQIVESHGGRIWAESREGSGATITFTVPLAETLVGPAAGRGGSGG